MVYEAPPTEDEAKIFERAQDYANRTGYLVRCVRHNPHLLKSFKPAVFRENPDAPPISNSDAPPLSKLAGLGYYAHRDDSAMFFDDRRQPTGFWKRRDRDNVVAWLNRSRYTRGKGEGGFYLNIVKPELLTLTKPIPASVTDFGDAVGWVLHHSEWRDA